MAFSTLLVLVASMPGAVYAQGKVEVAVMGAQGDKQIAPAVTTRLEEGVVRGLRASGIPLVASAEVSKRLNKAPKGLRGCRAGKCLGALRERLSARVAVDLSVQMEFESYFMTLQATDLVDGKHLLLRKGQCEICTLLEATTKATEVAGIFAKDLRPLLNKLAPLVVEAQLAPPAPSVRQVRLYSKPPGAAVQVDGTPKGKTPVTVSVKPGRHRFEFSRKGYEPLSRKMTVATGKEPAKLVVTMTRALPTAPPAPPAPRSPAPKPKEAASRLPVASGPAGASGAGEAGLTTLPARAGHSGLAAHAEHFPGGSFTTVAFAALGSGLVMLGVGGALMGMDGEITCEGPRAMCPTVYDTGNAGLFSVTVGGISLLSAVVLFVLEQVATGVGPETLPAPPSLGVSSQLELRLEPWLDPVYGSGGLLIQGRL